MKSVYLTSDGWNEIKNIFSDSIFCIYYKYKIEKLILQNKYAPLLFIIFKLYFI